MKNYYYLITGVYTSCFLISYIKTLPLYHAWIFTALFTMILHLKISLDGQKSNVKFQTKYLIATTAICFWLFTINLVARAVL